MRKTIALMTALASLPLDCADVRADGTNQSRGIEVSGSWSEKYVTRYVKGSGKFVSEGAVVQDTLRVDVETGKLGRFSASGFMNHDLETKKGPNGFYPNEIVLGTEHLYPFNERLSWKNAFMFGSFPEQIIKKDPDYIIDSVLKFKGSLLDLDLAYRHYLETENFKSVDRGTVGLSKKFNLPFKLGEWSFSVTPNARVVYQDNHIGGKGIHHITFGASVGAESKNFGFELFVNRQQGNQKLQREDLTYGGAQVKVKF